VQGAYFKGELVDLARRKIQKKLTPKSLAKDLRVRKTEILLNTYKDDKYIVIKKFY
jgi:hypothetical protein